MGDGFFTGKTSHSTGIQGRASEFYDKKQPIRYYAPKKYKGYADNYHRKQAQPKTRYLGGDTYGDSRCSRI